MNTVPEMISTKDLAYISDMFEWNFNVSKMSLHFSKEAVNLIVRASLKNVAHVHMENCSKLIAVLEEGGNCHE